MFEKLNLEFSKYDNNTLLNSFKTIVESGKVTALDSVWDVNVDYSNGGKDIKVRYTLQKEDFNCGSVGISFEEEVWDKQNYLFIPAAVYNGNRFIVLDKTYPPSLYHGDNIGPNIPVTITDVPHLNISEGESKIQLKAADMATPAVCVYDDNKKQGFILLFSYKTEFGYNGVTITESDDRKKAKITLTAPAVRNKVKYNMCTTSHPSPDKGADFKVGDCVEIIIKTYQFDCQGITELYDYFFNVRKAVEDEDSLKYELPYSKAMEIFIEKYNKENWNAKGKYYRVGTEDSLFQDFQSGWVGGGMNIYPLYMYGDASTKQRVKDTMHFILNDVQADSGFFYGMYFNGTAYGDAFQDNSNKNWLLLRKNADILYFLIKTYKLIKKDNKDYAEKCKPNLIKACDAFVRLWNKYGQWGQHIDVSKETIEVGSTASAAAGIASLVLGFREFGKQEYLSVAKSASEYYYNNFTKIGLTNGGPGEILQCPDSESAFALVESFVTLYEHTKEEKWLGFAKDAANQAVTWCVSYNFEFPKGSEFDKLDMKTVGSVYANVQNKHSAPGICTYSGDSLLKLYRFTSDKRYLDLAVEIAHNIMQYTSREDRPIHTLDGRISPSGYMNERVNMCDWENEEMVGSIFYGSCWCECSAMLTVSDIPSVYVVKNLDIVKCFDNVTADLNGDSLTIHNPTKFDCVLTLFVETSSDFKNNMDMDIVKQLRQVTVKSMQTINVTV